MDLADEASRVEEMFREGALRRAREARPRSASASTCASCADDIPPARQRAVPGATLCAHCQSIFDRYGRLKG